MSIPSLEFPLESEAQEIYSDLSTNADRNYTKVCSLVPEMPDRPENHENVWWKNMKKTSHEKSTILDRIKSLYFHLESSFPEV